MLMKNIFLCVFLLSAMLFGCGATQQDTQGQNSASAGGDANVFNPYLRESLPNTRSLSADGMKMLGQLGAKTQTIEGEAKHRKNWREELYPVVWGERKAPHEIIAVLDFSNPASQQVWSAVTNAAKQLNSKDCKIVVFGKSQENYGTDLMGMAIWLSYSRPGQAMPWLGYALARWNEIKNAQKSAGNVKKFTNEFDATASAHDYPIPFGYLNKLKPPLSPNQELAVARYCYDAGNVNMYQATQVCNYYGISSLPAVVVDGKVLGKVTADNIINAIK